jgi:branched-chain amino acid transport system permease protein
MGSQYYQVGANRVNWFVIIQTLLSSLMWVSVLSLSTFGIMIIFKTSTTTNFAQGMISSFGAFLAATLSYDSGVPLVLSILIGVVASFLLGIFIDSVIIRNAKHITPVGKQMITMGLALLLIGLLPLTLQRTQPSLRTLVDGNVTFELGAHTYSITIHSLITFGIALSTIVGLFIALKYTKWGLAVRATANNEQVASMMGVNTKLITAFSWAIAGGLGALAATLYGPTVGMSSVLYMTPIQVQGFMAAILGGFTTFHGPIVGSVILVFGGNLLGLGGEQMALYKELLVYVLILAVILVKPLGLFGKKVIKKV